MRSWSSAVPASKPVYIAAPYRRDADTIADVLRRAGYVATVHPSLEAMAPALDERVGAVVLTEEAISGDLSVLVAVLRSQEAWSDIPFILLRPARAHTLAHRAALPPEVINLVELERPLGEASLVSAVAAALKARQRQFVIRDQMLSLAASQAALAASEAELRLIADSLPVLIAFIDRGLVYRFANAAYESWLGKPLSEIVGQKVEDVIGPEPWATRKDAIAQALLGRPVRIEVSWPHRSGQRRDAEIRYLPRHAPDGSVDGFHVFATDVTARKVALQAIEHEAARLEARVAERTAELEAEMAARERSEAALRQAQKMEAVGQLTGGIAHDFNNMLTGILAAMDVMRMRIAQGRTDDLGRFIDVASGSAERAAALTQRLLAFSRRQSLDPRPVDVAGLVRSLEDLLARTLGERVRLTVTLDDDVPKAMVDRNQLESALLNLAINARDAMPEGGDLCVAVGARSGVVGCTEVADVATRWDIPEGEHVVISVTDTGVGMDEDTLSRVFEPFFTTKPIGQGTGLGMSMIYGFIQQSQGHIRVHSRPGAGTTVALYLPPCHDKEAAERSTRQDAAVSDGRGQRILLVEDDPQVRVLVADLLTELGYRVRTADASDAALAALADDAAIDLLITDVGLPGRSGRELASIVRQSQPSLPVLFMTGYAQGAATRSAFLDPGMSMILKPFELAAFSQAVNGMFARASTAG
ncbi:PAS domain-containing sensor histidine kinase [Luteibacter sp. 329MFSha]|uniref:hybrid sensor histidine kinase/response regulator n=1 Tax=Luteibacter sp. 329MFSha TaxID=1798239 RepID=UPI000B7F3B00|nr:PAS domain-containing sensor histidine kinase [Luteibacter sp. 329MFSha]